MPACPTLLYIFVYFDIIAIPDQLTTGDIESRTGDGVKVNVKVEGLTRIIKCQQTAPNADQTPLDAQVVGR